MKKRMKSKHILPFVMIILILAASCDFAEDQTGQNGENGEITDDAEVLETTEAKIEIGYMAPDFEVELLGGDIAKLSDYRGKAVLLNFWATWCEPCTAQMPDLQRLWEAFEGDLAVIAVNCGEEKDTVRAFISDNGYTFYTGLDESGAILDKYPTNVNPYTLIIDPAGTITGIYLGASGDMFSLYEKDINTALAKTD